VVVGERRVLELMKIIYSKKEKEISKIREIIQDYTWGIRGYKHYNIGYSPFHSELARILYANGYRKAKRKQTEYSER